jgi:hypothetical protein
MLLHHHYNYHYTSQHLIFAPALAPLATSHPPFLQVFGLWWGLTCGLGTLAIAYCILWSRIDWAAEAESAQTQAVLQVQLLVGGRQGEGRYNGEGGGYIGEGGSGDSVYSNYGALTDTGSVQVQGVRQVTQI